MPRRSRLAARAFLVALATQGGGPLGAVGVAVVVAAAAAAVVVVVVVGGGAAAILLL